MSLKMNFHGKDVDFDDVENHPETKETQELFRKIMVNHSRWCEENEKDLVTELEEFIDSLDEYSFNKVEYQTASSGVCSETIVIINETKIELEKVGLKYSLIFNGKSQMLDAHGYSNLYHRFADANREMQDVLNSEFYKSLES